MGKMHGPIKDNMVKTTPNIRSLIDQFFALQWCRDNLVAPLGIQLNPFTGHDQLTIAIANVGYLATIGDFIKTRAHSAGLTCQFIEQSPGKILELLEKAADERIIQEDDGVESIHFNDDAVLEALREADNDTSDTEFNFDDDDDEEQLLMEQGDDLSAEMLGSKIQQACAKLMVSAFRSNVSDIHVEPHSESYKIRVRRDGVMQNYVSMPRSAGLKLTACLKNMAMMDIAERRASQDGKILRHFEGKKLEFRCATAPAKFGEKMVMRLLNSSTEMLSLDILISNIAVREQFRSIINQANGIIIVSGPTGSGKSTTLASALREKDNGELNIVTAEDPIEYDLGGDIQQFPVIRAKGQTFAQLLRTFLRQDPDVILIGETRDPETAESSMDAAETGHLVFTTLHANSAASSLTRLIDMKVPGYKLASTLRGVLAQRLLRRVCPTCGLEHEITDEENQLTGLRVGTIVKEAVELSSEELQQQRLEGKLCPTCNGTGYKGRVGAYELLKINPNVADAIQASRSTEEIEQLAVENGMLTLKAYTVGLIADQLTTVSELKKISNMDS